MRLLTSTSIINDVTGQKRISFTYDIIDDTGALQKSNVKESFLVLDDETKSIITQLEAKVTAKMNVE